jgi:hypothetical protein
MKFLTALLLLMCLAGCSPKKAEDPISTSDHGSPANAGATLPPGIPSYDELLGSALGQKMKDGGPWTLDDLESMRTALSKLKELKEAFTAAGKEELAAAAQKRHNELSATYITLRQVAMTARHFKGTSEEASSADTSSEK